MKKSELKALIREAVEEVMNEFSPIGVAEKQQLHEKAPPDFPKALHDKLLKQYIGMMKVRHMLRCGRFSMPRKMDTRRLMRCGQLLRTRV